jgi:hypothetical protein
LIAVAISACCAAVVSLLRTEKPAWKKKAHFSAPARRFVNQGVWIGRQAVMEDLHKARKCKETL